MDEEGLQRSRHLQRYKAHGGMHGLEETKRPGPGL